MGFIFGTDEVSHYYYLRTNKFLIYVMSIHRRCNNIAVRRRTQWPNASLATVHVEFSGNVRVSIIYLHWGEWLPGQWARWWWWWWWRGANTGDSFRGRFFMSIGSVIRTEGVSSQSMEAYMRARRYPIIMQSSGEKRGVNWVLSSLENGCVGNSRLVSMRVPNTQFSQYSTAHIFLL